MWLMVNDGKKQLAQFYVVYRQWRRGALESERSEDVDERRTARNTETSTGNKSSDLAERQSWI